VCVCACVCQSVTPGRSREHTFEINIKPGWKAGTKLTYAAEGDEVQQGVCVCVRACVRACESERKCVCRCVCVGVSVVIRDISNTLATH
jgi:hypothetical protein